MATLTLTAVWINLLSSGAAVTAQSAPDRTEVYAVAGETRTYAGGRRRAVTSAGELGTYAFTLLLLARADVETLRSWQGLPVQVRDHKGRRFFGTFYGVNIAEYIDRSRWEVSITLSVVTAAEGV
jgi:hypothetical protein